MIGSGFHCREQLIGGLKYPQVQVGVVSGRREGGGCYNRSIINVIYIRLQHNIFIYRGLTIGHQLILTIHHPVIHYTTSIMLNNRRIFYILLFVLLLVSVVYPEPTLYRALEKLGVETKELVAHARSDEATHEFITPLNKIAQDIYDTQKKFYSMSTVDVTPYESVYNQLLNQYNEIYTKLNERRQHNKQEYVDTINTIKHHVEDAKQAVHHYVDELAPNTHVHSKSNNKPAEPSLYEKVLKHAQNMYNKAKNTIEIGSTEYSTIDSITYNTKKYHKQLQNIHTLELSDKISIAIELTKLQSQLEQFISESRANTNNFNQVESTKQLLIDSQNILRNDDSKIYSQSVKTKLTDAINNVKDTIKHNIIKPVESTTGNNQNTITHTITDRVSDIVSAARQSFNELTGNEVASAPVSTSNGIFDTISNKLSELTGTGSKSIDHSIHTQNNNNNNLFSGLINKFHELTSNKVSVAEPIDTSISGRVKNYYIGLYQRLINTVNNLSGNNQNKLPADKHTNNPIDSIKAYLGLHV